MPAAIARAYYVAMQPPCGPTFVSIPIDDWTRPTQLVEARQVSREIGPDAAAMTALVSALSKSKPGSLSYSVLAIPMQITFENWKKSSGADVVMVPSRGGSDGYTARAAAGRNANHSVSG